MSPLQEGKPKGRSTASSEQGDRPRILGAVEHSANIRARYYAAMHIHACSPVGMKYQEPGTHHHQAV